MKVEWKQDEDGRYTVINGWLMLAVSRRPTGGKFITLVNNCTLPVGSRTPEAFNDAARATDFLLGYAEGLLIDTARTLNGN